MNPFVLYLILVKATLTSFSGLTSLPMLHRDLIVERHVITERQLSASVAAGQTVPGPNGQYVVSVGYFAGGWPGAFAGMLALITPAFLIIPMLRYFSARTELPAVRRAIEGVTIAAAGLLIASTVSIGRTSLLSGLSAAIAVASFLFLVVTRRGTGWVILASAIAGAAAELAAIR